MNRKVPISISMPESVLQRVDASRGNVPRSQYILAIVWKSVAASRSRKKVRQRGVSS
jgi:metal-responsive CopG/Arc/MetJ family transcriptional regulator